MSSHGGGGTMPERGGSMGLLDVVKLTHVVLVVIVIKATVLIITARQNTLHDTPLMTCAATHSTGNSRRSGTPRLSVIFNRHRRGKVRQLIWVACVLPSGDDVEGKHGDGR